MVHGVWYNLHSFITSHPGGAFWLEQTRGMDITELFETHHVHTAKVQGVLQRYYVGPANSSYRGLYEYPVDGLHKTLNDALLQPWL